MADEIRSASQASDTLILVDVRNRILGATDKLDAHRLSLLHRAFSVFLTTPDDRFPMRRRFPGKYHSGGLWDKSCCGHPRPGLRTPAGIRRRAREELGVDCRPRFELFACDIASLDRGMTENEPVYVYSAPLVVEPDPDLCEIADLAFRPVAEIAADIRRAPGGSVCWLRRYVENHRSQFRAMAAATAGRL